MYLSAAISRHQFFRIFHIGQANRPGYKRQPSTFVRNELASAVTSRTADQHGIGLGFTPCPFAGQPLHVMKFIIPPSFTGASQNVE
jgi:hypothetical protein